MVLTVVQTLCTTPLSVNDLVPSLNDLSNKKFVTIYLGFHPPTHSSNTYLAISVRGCFGPSTFTD